MPKPRRMEARHLRCRFPEPEATEKAGAALASVLDDSGLVISIEGPLGVGKTVFVKGLAGGLGIDPQSVASPTFVLAHEYATGAGRVLRHVDFYRVEYPRELEEVGFGDFFEPGALLAVEWGDRFPEALPRDRLELQMVRPSGSPRSRRVRAVARGEISRQILDRWQGVLFRDAGIEIEPEEVDGNR